MLFLGFDLKTSIKEFYQVILKTLTKKLIEPPILMEVGQFIIKLAENKDEIEKAQRLRYKVFNIEQGKGLESAKSCGIDFDEFDEYCLHLIVLEKNTGEAIGTYRVHLGSVASSAIGFYSSREYDIAGIEKIADKCMELGRSCVSSEFRTGTVVGLLWGGIAELLNRAKLKLMLGCVSLEEKNPAAAWALYRQFKTKNCISDVLKAKPKKQFTLDMPPEDEIQKLLHSPKQLNSFIPPLFKGYLRIGCKICGEPAYDREFGTVDFLILVNKDEVPKRYMRHFNSIPESE